MRTVGNKVIVKPIMEETQSVSGIIVADCFQKRSAKGIVVATGCGTKKEPMKAQVGKTYFHVKDAGTEIEVNGQKYYVMLDMDLRAELKN